MTHVGTLCGTIGPLETFHLALRMRVPSKKVGKEKMTVIRCEPTEACFI